MRFHLKNLIIINLLFSFLPVWLFAEVTAEKNIIEFRIAADAVKDKIIAEKTKSSSAQNVYIDNTLVAKWVPILENKAASIGQIPSLVTRQNASTGQTDLLVLIGQNDLTNKDIIEIRDDIGLDGKLVLRVEFPSKQLSENKAYKLTKNNISRCVAEIIRGEVYATPEIPDVIYDSFVIPGDFTPTLIGDIAKQCGLKPPIRGIFGEQYEKFAPTRSQFIFACILVLVILIGSLPTRIPVSNKYKPAWLIAGIVLGGLIGAYKIGIHSGYVKGPTPITFATQISILGTLLGFAIGAVAGGILGLVLRFFILRAVNNILRFTKRIFRIKESGEINKEIPTISSKKTIIMSGLLIGILISAGGIIFVWCSPSEFLNKYSFLFLFGLPTSLLYLIEAIRLHGIYANFPDWEFMVKSLFFAINWLVLSVISGAVVSLFYREDRNIVS